MYPNLSFTNDPHHVELFVKLAMKKVIVYSTAGVSYPSKKLQKVRTRE
jgi:hypothetical protein